MADTRQIVSWALERKCCFRNGENWFLPDKTFEQLADLRTVARAEAEKRIVDGICITSYTTERDNTGTHFQVPCDGFRIEDRLGKYGGLSEALKTCQACEANVENELDTQVAGCFGYMDVWPDSPELDDQLWEIIRERNLEDQLRTAFQATTPLWYGFWMNSPLKRLQAEFLHELLDAACEEDDPDDDDVRHFLNALKAAIDWELPLHVSLAPLGHTDFGFYTIFPHCPRCKANAKVGRWQEEYSSEPYECKACGHTFNPNEHHSSDQVDMDWSADSLEKQLGEEELAQLTRRYLLHQGCTEEQADEVIDNKNNGPLLRRIAQVRQQRNASLESLRQNHKDIPQDNLPKTISFALSDDVELELVLVPAGEFLMGSSDFEDNEMESPQHLVRFEQPFYIGRFPVTQAQWHAVMGRNPSKDKGDPNLPVDQVSWFDCQEFCERLCHRQNRVFRLPSEAEWEYACRAGTTTRFAFGDVLLPNQANFTPFAVAFPNPPTDEEDLVRGMELLAESAEERTERKARPSVVGSYSPNAWGIYDMHGNVDEWCEDVWHPNYQGAPTDGSAWLDGEDKEPFRVMRGGWCAGTEFVCTSTSRRQLRADAGSREEEPEELEDEEEQSFFDVIFEMMYTPYGFRVVCEVG